MRILEKQEKKL